MPCFIMFVALVCGVVHAVVAGKCESANTLGLSGSERPMRHAAGDVAASSIVLRDEQ